MTPEQEQQLQEFMAARFEEVLGRAHGFGLRLRAVQFEFSPISPHEREGLTHRILHPLLPAMEN